MGRRIFLLWPKASAAEAKLFQRRFFGSRRLSFYFIAAQTKRRRNKRTGKLLGPLLFRRLLFLPKEKDAENKNRWAKIIINGAGY